MLLWAPLLGQVVASIPSLTPLMFEHEPVSPGADVQRQGALVYPGHTTNGGLNMSGEYVIQDPYHDYAIRFMHLMQRKYGWRAVCFYTNSYDWRMNHSRYPELRSSDLVSASYRLAPGGLPSFIEHLKANHDVRAVVPFYEPSVLNCSRIAAGLDLSWAQPQVLDRFRDKRAFKQHVAATDPSIRVNVGALVASPDEALQVVQREGFDRFVLKPNDGFGNVGIGIFDGNCSLGAVQEWWHAQDQPQLLLEEFIGGLEYHCDGQTDGAGNPVITDVFQYIRGLVNGRENIELGSVQVPHQSPLFAQIASYTERVVKASGLTRSPFHAEVKVDDRGPCLIECAARLLGLSAAPYINLIHGGSLDVFDHAAHYYATSDPYGDPGLNWESYDSRIVQQVNGVATKTERIYDLVGIGDVESMGEFLYWLKEPKVGDRVHQTSDIFGSAYMALIQAPTSEDLTRAAEYIQRSIQWNHDRRSVSSVCSAAGAVIRRRSRQFPSLRERRMPVFGPEEVVALSS